MVFLTLNRNETNPSHDVAWMVTDFMSLNHLVFSFSHLSFSNGLVHLAYKLCI